MDSTAALEIDEIPKRLLVIGGGIIGLEMATIYAALGSEVTVVEAPRLADAGSRSRPGAAPGAAHPQALRRHLPGDASHRRSRPARRDCASPSRGETHLPSGSLRPRAGRGGTTPERRTDRRRAGRRQVDERGFIPVDEKRRTNVPHIFAIGDITGPPLLAHKAVHEGKIAAEVIAGLPAWLRSQGDPVGGLHRSRGRLDGAHRDRGARRRGSRSRGAALPVGRQRPRPRHRSQGGARPSCSSRRRPASWSARGSSAPTPAS